MILRPIFPSAIVNLYFASIMPVKIFRLFRSVIAHRERSLKTLMKSVCKRHGVLHFARTKINYFFERKRSP